jgi:DNA-binding beta-propeller fold protein YncE
VLVLAALAYGYVRFLRPRTLPSPVQTVADVPLPGSASRLDYQSLDPQRRLLFISHLGAGTVIVFDIAAQKVVTEIPQMSGAHGVLAVPELGRIFATATDDHQLVAIDAATFQVVWRTPAGRYPDGLAYDPATKRVFVSDESGGGEPVIDAVVGRQMGVIPLGGEAGNTQYDPATQRIYVAEQTHNELVAIDPAGEPAASSIVARTPLPGCQRAHGVAVDAANRLAFAACEGNARLLVIDLQEAAHPQVTATYAVGLVPDVLTFDSEWHRLYVASESGVLSIFDEQGRRLTKRSEGFVASQAHTVAVDPRAHLLYLPLQDVGGRPVLRIAAAPVRA